MSNSDKHTSLRFTPNQVPTVEEQYMCPKEKMYTGRGKKPYKQGTGTDKS